MAAAIGVGLPVETPTGNMVIDVGGGTTEIAVIALSGLVAETSIRVGGDELDEAIVSFLRKNYNLLIGEPTAEAIKIQIGSAYPAEEEREMSVKGRDLVSGIPKTVRVNSAEIRECMLEPIQQIVGAVRRALEITPPELAADIVDRGIVMTGGGSLIRGLDSLLLEETGLPIHVIPAQQSRWCRRLQDSVTHVHQPVSRHVNRRSAPQGRERLPIKLERLERWHSDLHGHLGTRRY